MSNDISGSTKVATKFKELAEALGQDIEDVQVEVQQDFGSKTLDGKAIKEAMEKDATKGSESDDTTEGDDQSTTEDTIEDGDDDEDTIEDGEVACQCGAIFDSKQSLYGHSSHCDEYESQSSSKTEEEENTIEDGDEDTISDSELIEAGVKESNIEDVRKYRSKNGVCSEENCPYGANNGEDHCASHQGSSSSSKKKSSSSKKTKTSYEDLTKGQKAAVNNLLEEKADDDSFGVEEAVQMV